MVVQIMPKFINLGTKNRPYIINVNDIVGVENLSETNHEWYSYIGKKEPKCIVVVKSIKEKKM